MTRLRAGMLVIALLLASAAAMSRAVGAQPPRVIKIGALTESWGPTTGIVGLRDGLQALGYRENEHFVIGVRFTQGDPAELPLAARELVRHGVDIIVTSEASNAAVAAKAATSTIPIVFIGGSDPVGLGLVKSFARPGGNVTGIADVDELVAKRLEIFRELVPGLKRVLLPYDATNEQSVAQLGPYREAGRRLGITLIERPLRDQEEAQAVIAGIRRQEVDGILSPRFLSLNIPGFIVEAGSRQRIPTMLHAGFFVDRGALASYSPSSHAMGRQAARLVDRILKGAAPADLPVEQPTTFEFAVNLKVAAALGLTIPQSLLLRADRVVQ
ncbi:MAG TPA: ABC transporter substrate-binding protein [Candidatus Limnocylindria bacterium]|nr:ABC transporter substrate-binding protein [Candidatus Limnocylindria bacterium]